MQTIKYKGCPCFHQLGLSGIAKTLSTLKIIHEKKILFFLLFLSFAMYSLYGQHSEETGAVINDQYFTTSDGIELHYLEAGEGPVLIIQPGWMMPADIFKPQLEYLSNSFRLIVLDPRGQGLSEDSPTIHSIERRAGDIYELIKYEKIDSFILAGWSLGVPEVLYFLEKFGMDQLKGLVLIDGPIRTDLLEIQSGWKDLTNWLQKDRPGLEKVFIEALFKEGHDQEFISLIQERLSATPTNSAVVTMEAHVATPRDYRPILRNVQVPVLIALSPTWKSQTDAFVESNNSANVEFFECGHALFVDESDRFNSLIKTFFMK